MLSQLPCAMLIWFLLLLLPSCCSQDLYAYLSLSVPFPVFSRFPSSGPSYSPPPPENLESIFLISSALSSGTLRLSAASSCFLVRPPPPESLFLTLVARALDFSSALCLFYCTVGLLNIGAILGCLAAVSSVVAALPVRMGGCAAGRGDASGNRRQAQLQLSITRSPLILLPSKRS